MVNSELVLVLSDTAVHSIAERQFTLLLCLLLLMCCDIVL
jgi:hypothetical protein